MYVEPSPPFLHLNNLVIAAFELSCGGKPVAFRLEAVVVRLTLAGASLMFLAMDPDIIRALSQALAPPVPLPVPVPMRTQIAGSVHA
jgi:hypothetical protein